MHAGSQREEHCASPGAEDESNAAECRHRRTRGNEKGRNEHIQGEKHEVQIDKQTKEIESLKARLSAVQKKMRS